MPKLLWATLKHCLKIQAFLYAILVGDSPKELALNNTKLTPLHFIHSIKLKQTLLLHVTRVKNEIL